MEGVNLLNHKLKLTAIFSIKKVIVLHSIMVQICSLSKFLSFYFMIST